MHIKRNLLFSCFYFLNPKMVNFLSDFEIEAVIQQTERRKKILMPDRSLLPKELLHLISKNLEDYYFYVLDARSVCNSWRSSFPFSSCQLSVVRSAEMRWMQLKKTSNASCSDLVTFRGRFYAAFLNLDIFIFDPYSM